MSFANRTKRAALLTGALLLSLGAGCSSNATTDKEAADTRTKYEQKANESGTVRKGSDRTAGDPNVTGPPK